MLGFLEDECETHMVNASTLSQITCNSEHRFIFFN